MTAIIILGVLLVIIVVLALCYFLIPGLRHRESEGEKRTRAENAQAEVDSMVVRDQAFSRINRVSEEELEREEDRVEESASSLGLSLSPLEVYFIALERSIFARYRH